MVETLFENYGEGTIAALAGLGLGVLFGLLAYLSRFCMRSAALEVFHGKKGDRLALWLLTLGVAIIGTQALLHTGAAAPDTIRQITSGGSYSGALVGGTLFGIGMVLTRGCISRLMILAPGGNLRALVSVVIFALVAFLTMKGALGEARTFFAALAPVPTGHSLDLTRVLGVGAPGGMAFGVLVIMLAAVIGFRRKMSLAMAMAGIGIGLTVVASYAVTALFNGASFNPQPVKGLSFIAPTVNVLAGLIPPVTQALDFDAGLIPGVFLGAAAGALASGRFRLEWFASPLASIRYVIGAALMGFGGVLAGGCALGNGVSGFAIYATPALIALAAMWFGIWITDALVDRRAWLPTAPSRHFVPAE